MNQDNAIAIIDHTEYAILDNFDELLALTGSVAGVQKAAVRTEVDSDKKVYHRILYRLDTGALIDVRIPMERP